MVRVEKEVIIRVFYYNPNIYTNTNGGAAFLRQLKQAVSCRVFYDFRVVLLDATHAVEEALTHADLLSECTQSLAANAALGSAFLERAFSVVAGAEPPAVYPAVGTRRNPDYLLKALKWILAQEDINYPIQRGMQGRRVLADRLAEVLDGVPLEHVLQRTCFVSGPPPPRLRGVDDDIVDRSIYDYEHVM